MSRKLGWEDESIGDPQDGEELDFGESKPAKKPRRKAKPTVEDDLPWADMDPKDPEPETKVEKTARVIGVVLSLECPLCRSLDPCECTEEDRSFQRRVRFTEDVKKVARCERCGCALSTIYLPRPNTEPPYDLVHMHAFWGCAPCHGGSLAMVAAGQAGPR